MTPRGIRNHNPGNIRHGAKWQGLSEQQTDRSFCQFTDPVWGLRALFKLLLNYQKLHGLCSIRVVINRYAPPVENHTENYIQAVANSLNVSPDDCLTLEDKAVLFEISKAIIKVENSNQQPYSQQQFEKAYSLL
ncbi:structural protein [Providencia stuartii]|uniref:structural protein n=1 Tax=Providencia stuartii TaxID=588 RepID=UPI0023E2F06E|nr:structural protein [Providencia stuartii]WER20913.1 structural protein [Providencia stuartii]WER25033.1 structural protein [Providencia stuartii]WER29123.1 structural protein [Providencia stuartii]